MDELLQYVMIANTTLLLAYVGAWLFDKLTVVTYLRRAYRLRLHLAVAALCTAALPIIIIPFTSLFTNSHIINGTDLIVSQFLKGNLGISATQLSDAITLKEHILDFIVVKDSSLAAILLTVFAILGLMRAIYIGINILKVSKHVSSATPLHRSKRVDIRLSTKTNVPFSTRGLFKYYIIIPVGLTENPKGLLIALGHEAQHIRQNDVNWEILLSFISPLFVINPAFWLLSDRIRRFREYTCDAALLKRASFSAHEYCLLLLEIATQTAQDKRQKKLAYAASVPFFGRDGLFNRSSQSALKLRVLALAQGSEWVDNGLSRYVNFAPACLLVMIVAIGVVLSAKPADWSHDRLMLSTVVNLERLDRINEFGIAPLR